MKTIWKGYLKISLVSIPIKMYNATTRGSPIKFHLLHDKCNTRIRQQKICPKCDRPVDKDEIVKGYPYGKDMYVVLTDEEIEQAQKEATDFIDIVQFVDWGQISPVYIFDAHFLVPDGKAGAESFAVFHQAMARGGKAAVAKVVLRNKEHLLSIRPQNGVLMAYSLHYPEEVQTAEGLNELEELNKVKVDKNHLEMAETLIENLAGNFDPNAYVDEYTEKIKEMIQAKAEGQEIQVAPEVEKGKVVNFMDALEKSIQKTEEKPKKKMAKAGKKRSQPSKKRKKG